MAPRQDIYLAHFGLRQRPFALLPDPDFLYWSEAHRSAHAMMDYGLMTQAPITLITGEIGVGKTTLLQHFLASLEDDVTVGLIANAPPGTTEILPWVLPALGQDAPENLSDVALFLRFRTLLETEYAAGRAVLLVIDEAQNMGRAALEQLRMLTNINSGKSELLQLLLVGQPELRDIVKAPDMTQFAQRVAATFHIPAMDPTTVLGYIAHRIRVAGGTPEVFSRQAAELVQEATGGVPRLVNQLCDLALTYAFSAGLTRVRRATVQQVLDDGVFFGGGRRRLIAAWPSTGGGSDHGGGAGSGGPGTGGAGKPGSGGSAAAGAGNDTGTGMGMGMGTGTAASNGAGNGHAEPAAQGAEHGHAPANGPSNGAPEAPHEPFALAANGIARPATAAQAILSGTPMPADDIGAHAPRPVPRRGVAG